MQRRRQADTARTLPTSCPRPCAVRGISGHPAASLRTKRLTPIDKQSMLCGCLGEERPPHFANQTYGAVKSPKDQSLKGPEKQLLK